MPPVSTGELFAAVTSGAHSAACRPHARCSGPARARLPHDLLLLVCDVTKHRTPQAVTVRLPRDRLHAAMPETSGAAPISFKNIAQTEKKDVAIKTVQLSGSVAIKILQHCSESDNTGAYGQLLGLDVSSILEVTECFPSPVRLGAVPRAWALRLMCKPPADSSAMLNRASSSSGAPAAHLRRHVALCRS